MLQEMLTKLRVRIDYLMGLTEDLKPVEEFELDEFVAQGSFQTYNASTSLSFGKAWLGKMLGYAGKPSPYKNDGKRKTVRDIEKTADVAERVLPSSWNQMSHVEKVDWLRQQIDSVSRDLLNGIILQTEIESHPLAKLAANNAYTHLCEARFWLGFELERILSESESGDIRA
jgi:hypothetical protein